MIQVTGLPPNFAEIVKVFPAANGINTIFAFGDTIYVPSGNPLPPELLAHELVHGTRQTEWPGGVDKWWRDYLENSEIRQAEEVMAHRAEYREYCRTNRDRNDRSRYLQQVARRLASPLYGGMVGVKEALKLLTSLSN